VDSVYDINVGVSPRHIRTLGHRAGLVKAAEPRLGLASMAEGYGTNCVHEKCESSTIVAYFQMEGFGCTRESHSARGGGWRANRVGSTEASEFTIHVARA
jgi:hypothetical protein